MQEGTPIIIKKIKKGGHGHHGGAWKVAYADFVTAMMAFFLVMWILGMSDEEKKSIALYFQGSKGISKIAPRYDPRIGLTTRTPAPMSGGTADQNGMSLEQKELTSVEGDIRDKIAKDPELKKLAKAGDIDIKKTSEGLQIEIIENETNGEVFFESGSAVVRPKAQQVFAAIAPILGKTNRYIEVDGHTDRTPYGNVGFDGYDNYDLSSDRALAVKRLLCKNGVGMHQILKVTGKADTDPRLPDKPYDFSNRRVTILLPYEYTPGSPKRLPAEIPNQKVEGAFAMPEGAQLPKVDLRQKYLDQKAEEDAHLGH